jgi:uncharacterized membrane protein
MTGTVDSNSPFRTINNLRRTHEQEAADGITRFSGTMTFVLMSQNVSAKRDAERERNDHLTDLWSEAWAEMIGEKLGIDSADVRKRYEKRLHAEEKARDSQGAA